MKKLFLITGLTIASIIITAFAYQNNKAVKHIVVFKYKSTATPAQIDKVTSAFLDLKNKIPGITSFEYGVNNSP